VLEDFNLLVTTARGNEEDACSEIWYLVGEMGDQAVEVDKTGISGLVAAKTTLDPFKVIAQLRKILNEHPSEFRYTLRVIPIEKVVPTQLIEIQRAATELASKIGENETFRATVEKRFTNTSRRDLIEAAVTNVERSVDLDNPDKVVLIEVVGKLTGISVIEPSDIISVTKETPSM
jgi:tRNA acetyltransferase TAN1